MSDVLDESGSKTTPVGCTTGGQDDESAPVDNAVSEESAQGGSGVSNSPQTTTTVVVGAGEKADGKQEYTFKNAPTGRKRRAGEVSPALGYFNILEKPLPSGKNAQCQIMTVKDYKGDTVGDKAGRSPEPCLEWLTTQGHGNKSLIRHLHRRHKAEHAIFQARSKRSKAARENKVEAVSEKGKDTTDEYTHVALSAKQKRAHNRTFVIETAIDFRSPHRRYCVGYQIHVGGMSAALAAEPMHSTTFDDVLLEVCAEVKGGIVGLLMSQREAGVEMGYTGPFCGFQLDMATVAAVEYCTATVTFVPPDFRGVVRVALAASPFPRQHTYTDIQLWIEKLVTEYCAGFMGPAVKPRDVFVAGTADQGGTVLNALRELQVPVLVCAAHRLNAAVVSSLGVNGSKKKGRNGAGKELVARAVALAGAFSHSAVNSDVPRDTQDEASKKKAQALRKAVAELSGMAEEYREDVAAMERAMEMEEVGGSSRHLNVVRRDGTRFGSTYSFLKRLLELKPSIDVYFGCHSTNSERCLTGEEWVLLRQLVSLLEPATDIVKGIQGGRDGFLSRILFLTADLVQAYNEEEQVVMSADGADADPGTLTVSEMMGASQTFLKVVVEELVEKRGLGTATTAVESVALFLDPRTKSCDADVCVNGSPALKKRAKFELELHADVLQDKESINTVDGEEAGGVVEEQGAAERAKSPPAGRRKERVGNGSEGVTAPLRSKGKGKTISRVALRQQRRLARRAQAGAGAGVGAGGASSKPRRLSSADALKQELRMYEEEEDAPDEDAYDLLRYWKEKATATADERGAVVRKAKMPLLAMFARLHHGVDGTSCQAERSLSCLGPTLGGMRRGVTVETVERLMYLRLNQGLIPEVARHKSHAAEVWEHAQKDSRASPAVGEYQRGVAGVEVAADGGGSDGSGGHPSFRRITF